MIINTINSVIHQQNITEINNANVTIDRLFDEIHKLLQADNKISAEEKLNALHALENTKSLATSNDPKKSNIEKALTAVKSIGSVSELATALIALFN